MMRGYRLLLRLYPASFRGEYEREMCAVLRDRLREAGGAAQTAAVHASAILDVLRSAPLVHLDLLRQDVRYCARVLRRTPGFAATVVLVTALGIGATTAAFGLADHVLLRPLPFRASHRLVKLWQDQSFRGYSRMELSPGNYVDWKRQSTSFEAMAAYVERPANLAGRGTPERLEGAAVTPELFGVLGVQPALGRIFSEDGEADEQAVILGHSTFTTLFGGDAGVLGRPISLDGRPHAVIGVMPPGFFFPTRETELWTPLRFRPQQLQDRSDVFLRVVARLRDNVGIDAARSELSLIARRLERAYPKENERTGANVIWLRDEVAPQSRQMLAGLVAASVCVLAICAANVANLLLARALVRRREIAVRVAIGAGPERLVRQLVTESLMLSAVGGACGVILAALAVPLAARLVPNVLPIAEIPPMDVRVLCVAALITLLTGLGFGVVPALRLTRAAAAAGLREDGRGGPGRRTEVLRATLVVAEIAASVVLLVSAALLVRALWRVQESETGFRTEGVLTLRTSLPLPQYRDTGQRVRFYRQVLSEVRLLPGVSSAAYISFLPMVMRGGIWPVEADEKAAGNSSHTASLRFITPDFFRTLGIPLRQGRDVSESDTADTQPVAVVSESFVRRHWPGRSALGRRLHIAFDDRVVVGVVGDIRVRGLERASEPQVYLPYQQVADGALPFYTPKDLVIKAEVPSSLRNAVREIVARADPNQPISDVRLLADIVGMETVPRRVQVRAIGAFAAIAFVLAALGIHGLLAFNVSARLREIGVRIALGARSIDVASAVVLRAAGLAVVGVAVGTLLAYIAARGLQSMLAGIDAADPAAFTFAGALSLVMTVLGTALPAWRAVRVDPLIVLRSE